MRRLSVLNVVPLLPMAKMTSSTKWEGLTGPDFIEAIR